MTKTGAAAFEPYARVATDHLVADLMRRCARDRDVLALVAHDRGWDAPHRLFAAVDWLVETGRADPYRSAGDPWAAFRSICLAEGDWIRDFMRTHPVQTNEVQRCFALLPIFLTLARGTRQPLDLVELGASAGLNLLWDRYRYRYRSGTWGPAGSDLELSGEERGAVPAALLAGAVTVRGRMGVDLRPLDVRNEDDVRLLRIFSASHRHARLMAAVEMARTDPPTIVRGDYLQVLPELLADRPADGLTVVIQTLSTVYLSDAERARLKTILDRAGSAGPLAYVGTPSPEEHGQQGGDYPIELITWPGREHRFVARMENHGEWIDWLG